jgi:hypothetical protein
MQLSEQVPPLAAAEQPGSVISQAQLHSHQADARVKLWDGSALTQHACAPDVLHVAQEVLCVKQCVWGGGSWA